MERIETIGSVKASEVLNADPNAVYEDSLYDKIELMFESINGRERLLGIEKRFKEYDIDIHNNLGKKYRYVDDIFIRTLRRIENEHVYYMSQININAVNGTKYNINSCIRDIGIIANSNTSIELEGEYSSLYIYRNGAYNFKLKLKVSGYIDIIFIGKDEETKWIDLDMSGTDDLSLISIGYAVDYSVYKGITNGSVHTANISERVSSVFNSIVFGRGIMPRYYTVPVINGIELMKRMKELRLWTGEGVYIDAYLYNKGICHSIEPFQKEMLDRGFRKDIYNHLMSHREDSGTNIVVK